MAGEEQLHGTEPNVLNSSICSSKTIAFEALKLDFGGFASKRNYIMLFGPLELWWFWRMCSFFLENKTEGEAACFFALTSLRSARVVVPFTAPGWSCGGVSGRDQVQLQKYRFFLRELLSAAKS